ncbi:hypothetical protein BaRGS_00010337, partial [Batillaria attramentaria]
LTVPCCPCSVRSNSSLSAFSIHTDALTDHRTRRGTVCRPPKNINTTGIPFTHASSAKGETFAKSTLTNSTCVSKSRRVRTRREASPSCGSLDPRGGILGVLCFNALRRGVRILSYAARFARRSQSPEM